MFSGQKMLFGTPSKLQDGRYFLKVTNDEGQKAMHQLNNVRLVITDDNQVTVTGVDPSLFSQVDDQIITQAKECKVLWFGKEISDETVVGAYQTSLNPESELCASLTTIKGKIVTTAYDTQKKQVTLVDVGTGPVDAWFELIGLVFTKRTFEPVWKVVQVRIRSAPKSKFPREYLFRDDEDDEDDDQEVDL
jgi:nitrogen fixation protein FixH